MTRKDYELIAEVLADLDGHEIGLSIGAHEAVSRSFADALAASNPRFDRDRFLKAAGVAL